MKKLISDNKEPSNLLAYCVASMLRFLTPLSMSKNGIFTGKLPISCHSENKMKSFSYGNNLEVNLVTGEYQFRNDCDPNVPDELFSIANSLLVDNCDNRVIKLLTKLLKLEDLNNYLFNSWLNNISSWYFYILREELKSNPSNHLEILERVIYDGYWVKEKDLNEIIHHYVNTTSVIDLHTHLFPSSHESLFLYGIDELLTYHYLVAEYFQTAPSDMTPESKLAFLKIPKLNLIF